MPEPLKNLYTRELIDSLSQEISAFYREFDADGFTEQVFGDLWHEKELKERMRHISESLHCFLPQKYAAAIEILINAGSQFKGFEYMFFPGFVELYGLEQYQESIAALEHFTKYSSSEFAVRPFIKKYQRKMMGQMEIWAESDNYQVRRLASEGCRPRLPWAMALPDFKQDPSPILPILSKLKNDQSEYVRRSVANNLNDISKDNPQVVIKIAHNWLGDTPQVDWVVKHGCRTLLKQGEPEIIALFGFSQPEHLKIYDFQMQKSVAMGDELSFSFSLKTQRSQLGKLRIEYGIDFVKKNGRRSRKVFKLSEAEVTGQEKLVQKSHSFRKISTRKYYAGRHGVAIIVNGYELASKEFMLS
ncbi:MAG: DNA alkylation repair protein [Cyanobacteria bacterium P01_G01_bin.39]